MPSAQLVDATWLKPLLISDASRGGLAWPPGTLMHATSAMPLQRERSGALKKRGGAVLWAPTPHSCLTLPHDVALHSRRNYCGIVVVGPFVFSRVLLYYLPPAVRAASPAAPTSRASRLPASMESLARCDSLRRSRAPPLSYSRNHVASARCHSPPRMWWAARASKTPTTRRTRNSTASRYSSHAARGASAPRTRISNVAAFGRSPSSVMSSRRSAARSPSPSRTNASASALNCAVVGSSASSASSASTSVGARVAAAGKAAAAFAPPNRPSCPRLLCLNRKRAHSDASAAAVHVPSAPTLRLTPPSVASSESIAPRGSTDSSPARPTRLPDSLPSLAATACTSKACGVAQDAAHVNNQRACARARVHARVHANASARRHTSRSVRALLQCNRRSHRPQACLAPRRRHCSQRLSSCAHICGHGMCS